MHQPPVLNILCILCIHVIQVFFVYMDEQDIQDFFVANRFAPKSDSKRIVRLC